MNDPRTRFINLAVACCHCGDWTAIETGFSGLDEPLALDLAREVSERLAKHGQITGNLKPWAAALHHLPRPGWREAGQVLAEHLDAWATPRTARPADDGARRLRRLACRLIRARVPGRELLHQLDEANGTLSDPVSAEAIGRIAKWAAHAARKDAARA